MGKAARLLIVDDDPAFADSLYELVTAHGYEAQVAHTVGEAKRAAERDEPVAVLLDLGLPDRAAGLQLASWMHDRFLGTVAVIVISGHAAQQDRDDALEHKADYVLAKPLDVDRLRAIIDAR